VKAGVAVDMAEREKVYRGKSDGGDDEGVAVCAVLVEDRYMALAVEAIVHRKIRHAMVPGRSDVAWPRGVNHLLFGGTCSSVLSEWDAPAHGNSFMEVVVAAQALGELVLECARSMTRKLSPDSAAPEPVKRVLAFADPDAQRFKSVAILPTRLFQRAPSSMDVQKPRKPQEPQVMEILKKIVIFTGRMQDTVSLRRLSDTICQQYIHVQPKLIKSAMVELGATFVPAIFEDYSIRSGFRGACIPVDNADRSRRQAGRTDEDCLMDTLVFTQNKKDVLHIAALWELGRHLKLSVNRDVVTQRLIQGGALWSNNAVDASGKRSRGYTKLKVAQAATPITQHTQATQSSPGPGQIAA